MLQFYFTFSFCQSGKYSLASHLSDHPHITETQLMVATSQVRLPGMASWSPYHLGVSKVFGDNLSSR